VCRSSTRAGRGGRTARPARAPWANPAQTPGAPPAARPDLRFHLEGAKLLEAPTIAGLGRRAAGPAHRCNSSARARDASPGSRATRSRELLGGDALERNAPVGAENASQAGRPAVSSSLRSRYESPFVAAPMSTPRRDRSPQIGAQAGELRVGGEALQPVGDRVPGGGVQLGRIAAVALEDAAFGVDGEAPLSPEIVFGAGVGDQLPVGVRSSCAIRSPANARQRERRRDEGQPRVSPAPDGKWAASQDVEPIHLVRAEQIPAARALLTSPRTPQAAGPRPSRPPRRRAGRGRRRVRSPPANRAAALGCGSDRICDHAATFAATGRRPGTSACPTT